MEVYNAHHSGVSCHQCACTLAHRIIHRAEFFPMATCQRHRLRQLALGLARKARASGRPICRLPRKGPLVFSSLAAPPLVRGGSLSACRSESPSILLKGNTPAGRSTLVTQQKTDLGRPGSTFAIIDLGRRQAGAFEATGLRPRNPAPVPEPPLGWQRQHEPALKTALPVFKKQLSGCGVGWFPAR